MVYTTLALVRAIGLLAFSNAHVGASLLLWRRTHRVFVCVYLYKYVYIYPVKYIEELIHQASVRI